MHRHQRRGQVVGRHVDRPPHRVLVDLGAQFGGQVGGQRVGGLQHRVHQACRTSRRSGRSAIGEGTSAPAAGVTNAMSAHLVVEFDDLRFAAHPDALLRRAHQTGIGGAPPGGVDAAVEVPGGQVSAARGRARQCRRSAISASSTTGPPAASHSRNRCSASSSVTVLRLALVADRVSPGRRSRSSRDSPPLGSSRDGAHHATTCDLRPGHRHVHQAAVVAGGSPGGPAPATARVVRAVGAADVQAPTIVVVEQDQVTILHIAVERERQVDDRELQALAAVHRHDLNGGGVAVEAPVALGGAAALLAAAAQPVPQRGQGEVLAVRGLLQQLGQRAPYRSCTARRRASDSTRSAMPRSRAASNTAATPHFAGVVGPLPDGLGDAVGQRITAGGKVFGGLAEEHRRRGRAHHPGAVRLVERLQQGQPVVAGVGGEDVGVAGVDGGDAGVGQRARSTPGRPCASRRSPRYRRPRPARRRRWPRWPAARRCRRPDPGRCRRAGRRSGSSWFRCGRTSPAVTTRSRNGSLCGAPASRLPWWWASTSCTTMRGSPSSAPPQHRLQPVDQRGVTAPVGRQGLLLARRSRRPAGR